MNLDPLALSARGDRAFELLLAQFPNAQRWRLLIEQRLDPDRFAAIRAALLAYIARVLDWPGVLEERDAMERLLIQRPRLPNYTRAAMLAATHEHTLEFNSLHRSLALAVREYGLDPLVDGIDLPINVRLVYGEADETRLRAPYSSAKLHSEIWAGVPPDAAVVVLPVLGDIDDIAIEYFEMDPAQERGAMRAMRDYDEGSDMKPVKKYDDCVMKHGHLYVADARLLKQTVRRKRTGIRLSLDFRFRYNDPEYRALTPPIERGGPGSIDSRVPYADWQAIGTDSLIVFDDTMQDLRERTEVGSSAPVSAAKYRLLPLTAARRG